jgi:hypothetical protein
MMISCSIAVTTITSLLVLSFHWQRDSDTLPSDSDSSLALTPRDLLQQPSCHSTSQDLNSNLSPPSSSIFNPTPVSSPICSSPLDHSYLSAASVPRTHMEENIPIRHNSLEQSPLGCVSCESHENSPSSTLNLTGDGSSTDLLILRSSRRDGVRVAVTVNSAMLHIQRKTQFQIVYDPETSNQKIIHSQVSTQSFLLFHMSLVCQFQIFSTRVTCQRKGKASIYRRAISSPSRFELHRVSCAV